MPNNSIDTVNSLQADYPINIISDFNKNTFVNWVSFERKLIDEELDKTSIIANYRKFIENYKKCIVTSNLYMENKSLVSETSPVQTIVTKEDDFDNFYNNFSSIILLTSKYDTFEAGVISNTSAEILSFFDENPHFTKKSIQKMFHDMYDNQQLMIGLLDGISGIEYNLAKEELPIIATAALSHENDTVVEYGIRCFENWRNKDSLQILRKLKCREEWMNVYVGKIVSELERELS